MPGTPHSSAAPCCHNAGDPDGWAMTLDVNLLGPMHLTRRLVPAMKERRDGVIINTGSMAGTQPMSSGAHYAASKWGVRGWVLACYEVCCSGGRDQYEGSL